MAANQDAGVNTEIVRSGSLPRADVITVLDAGLGRFFGVVETTPELDGGRFVGFRIVAFHAPPWRDTPDLAPGDVVTRVNGRPIERPEHAMEIWSALRVATELVIEYRRAGELREVRFEIIDPTGP